MARKKIHNTAADRQKAHIASRGGRRATFVLDARACLSLEFLRDDMGMNDTQLVNHALVALAGSRANPVRE